MQPFGPEAHARVLLAAASAGLLSQAASAATYDDLTSDLSNDSNAPTPISYLNYDSINGRLLGFAVPDPVDALRMENLLAGSVQVDITWSRDFGGETLIFGFSDSSGGSVGVADFMTTDMSGTASETIVVPGDGILRIVGSSNHVEQNPWAYTLTFTSVPESASNAAGAILSLAALLELRRRRDR